MSENQKPVLSLAAGYHLRAKALCDGRVTLKNFALNAVAYENDGLGHDEFLAGKFAAGEFSLAMYLALKSRGAPYLAIPVFPNRKFRQSYIFVPENSTLRAPAQLKGKKVGIPSWLNTAGLWARGILSDEYGVQPQDIHWIMPRKNKVDLALPAGTRVDVVASQESLAARMLQGEFDAIIVPDFPDEKGWRRLFADSKAVEQEFYRRTGIFPTSHAITFHTAYLERHPTAAQEMFEACVAAKNLALCDDADATYSNFVWNRQVWEEQQAVMGADPWKFGIKDNENVLNTIIRFAEEQGLLAKKMTIDDLFIRIDEA
ncbi:MAG TPA: PhnD/SsuA/transferrin family substrate-binding protein [Acidobacteriota bacterium]|nr:PhnD/SsuA/transferrin family substrate-binding protein [Acidobacteriota bacterium]